MDRSEVSEIDAVEFEELLLVAQREDLGEAGDVTTQLLPESFPAEGLWEIAARMPGVICGITLLPKMLHVLCPGVTLQATLVQDGGQAKAGEVVARLKGNTREMLGAERTLLNILQHLSGVATLTSQFVEAVRGTGAKIFDTRKTLPGLRKLEKYAVRCGGGFNHRAGLYDAVLIKDNHLGGIGRERIGHAVFEMLNKLGTLARPPSFVEVECDSLDQLSALLRIVGIDVILLDNFRTDDLREAVALRDAAGLRGKVALEASGGITLENVREVAETGVERIAVGAITHSAPALDLGLDAI